ncbi:MAG: CvpA family protein [Candidatus Kerfeldbacteria bacterium]|nr:CvpA family protein [Candidatus Kerfeldbacteria bacterium]
MTTLEIVLLAVIAGFGIVGFAKGLIQAIGSIIGVVIGTIVATRAFDDVAALATPLFGGNQIAASVTAFIVLFLLTSQLVGFVVRLIDQAFKIIALFPGLKLINRVGGLVLGLFEGVLVVGVVLHLVTRLPISNESLTFIRDSFWLRTFLGVGDWLVPLFPEALKKAREITW